MNKKTKQTLTVKAFIVITLVRNWYSNYIMAMASTGMMEVAKSFRQVERFSWKVFPSGKLKKCFMIQDLMDQYIHGWW